MTEVNHKFADHVTSVAFNLTLSKKMVIALVSIAEGNQHCTAFRVLGMTDTSVPTRSRLEERGLIFAPDPELPGIYELTEAGKLVMELLKVAGMVEKIDRALGDRTAA